MRTIVTYESYHGTAKKLAEIIAEKLYANCISIDLPYLAEQTDTYDAIVMVIAFRGPYTAQLTKLFIERMGESLKDKHLIVVGEGLYSYMEFPGFAEKLRKMMKPASFHCYFSKGELRVDRLSFEEKNLLENKSFCFGGDVVDKGNFNEADGNRIGNYILTFFEEMDSPVSEESHWVCPLCGYMHTGDTPPSGGCPVCYQPSSSFRKAD